MLEWFERLWAVRVAPSNPDVIVPLDYAHSKSGYISTMTRAGLVKATEALARYPEAVMVCGNSSHSYPGSEVKASLSKSRLLKEWTIPMDRVFDAGGIVNSVTEAFAIRTTLHKNGIAPKEILVITGPQHSRSALYIWQRVFPGVRISLQHFVGPEWQPGHIFPSQRSGWVWARANVLRQVALRIMGLKWVAKRQHKPAH